MKLIKTLALLSAISSLCISAEIPVKAAQTATDGNGIERVLNLIPSEQSPAMALLENSGKLMQLTALPAAQLPSQYSNQENCSAVWNQLHLGACTGFASKSAVELLWNITHKDQKNAFTGSALFEYFNARELEGNKADEDHGASIAGTILSLIKFGIAPDQDWDYSDYQTKFKLKPIPQAYKDALQHVDLDSFKHAKIQNTPESVKTALVQNHGVIIGMAVYQSFMSESVAKSGLVPFPNIASENLLGGHALHVVGYDDQNKWYIVKNSWGEDWGDKGYCYIPYSIIHNKQLVSDIYGIVNVGPATASKRAWYNPLGWIGW